MTTRIWTPGGVISDDPVDAVEYEAATADTRSAAAGGGDMEEARRSGTLVIDGVRYVIKAGVTRWKRRLVEELSFRKPEVASYFRASDHHLPARTESRDRESWRLP